MSYQVMAIFFGFVVINTACSFIAGQRAGKWEGIVGTMRFLKAQKCLKPKSSIKDFKNWPEPLQQVYSNPEEIK